MVKPAPEDGEQGDQKDGSKGEEECLPAFSLQLNMLTDPEMGEPAGKAEGEKVNNGTDQVIPGSYGICLNGPWQGKDDGNDQRDP